MRRKKRAFWYFLLALMIVLVLLICINGSFAPTIRSLAGSTVSNRASNIINEAIEAQLKDGTINYDAIIVLEKDLSGNITAIKTNIAEVNRLKTQTLSLVDRMVLDLDIEQIGVPLGSLILPQFFSGTGPKVPVRIVSVSNSEADFRNVFMEAGINQTIHQIMLDVRLNMTVLTPLGTQSVEAVSSVVVAETVIVGKVPGSYVDLN